MTDLVDLSAQPMRAEAPSDVARGASPLRIGIGVHIELSAEVTIAGR